MSCNWGRRTRNTTKIILIGNYSNSTNKLQQSTPWGTCSGPQGASGPLSQQIPAAGAVSMEQLGWPGGYLGHRQQGPSLPRTPISQNHRISWVGKDLWGYRVQTVTNTSVSYTLALSAMSALSSEYSDPRHLPGQSIQCLITLSVTTLFIMSNLNPPRCIFRLYRLVWIWIAPGVKPMPRLFQRFGGCVWHGRAQLRAGDWGHP